MYNAISPWNTAKSGCSLIIRNTLHHFEFGKLEPLEIQISGIQLNSLKQLDNLGVVYCSTSSIKNEIYSYRIRL